MRSALHELALKVGFEVVNVEEDYTDYEYTEKISGVESISYIIKVEDKATSEQARLTFDAILTVLPKKLRKRIYKLMKGTDIATDEKSIELAIFAVEEYKAKCDYNMLKEYGRLLNVDIEKLGYHFTYNLSKKDARTCLAQIEHSLPIKLAPVLGKIKKIEYKIGYIKNNKVQP